MVVMGVSSMGLGLSVVRGIVRPIFKSLLIIKAPTSVFICFDLSSSVSDFLLYLGWDRDLEGF